MKTKTILLLSLSIFFVQIGFGQNTNLSLSQNLVFGQKDYKKNPQSKSFLKSKLLKIKGVKDANYGMVLIPKGSANIQSKTTSVEAFWIDATEITNLQYKIFVDWVRDSIAMRLCVKNGLTDFQIENNNQNISQFYDASDANQVHLNWGNRKLLWKGKNHKINEATIDMFYSNKDNVSHSGVLDTRILVYEYWYVDLNGMGALVKHKKVPVYPDTLVFMKYFSATYNEPIMQRYFSHPAFENYPVVGLTWEQANAFCHWRTEIVNNQLQKLRICSLENYRLPTEAEWEYAAMGGNNNSIYPWGNDAPQSRCNFVGTPSDKTTPVGIYAPNNFGLYDMAGNVAEWTSDDFDNNGDKVVKGGSWLHGKDFIKTASKAYIHKDSANYYTGFRCVRTYLGKEVQSWQGY